MVVEISKLDIGSPKRSKRRQSGWEGFFPYYAGFPSAFAKDLLKSAGLARDQIVLDPWNGSGTTTHAASALGVKSVGYDLNPAMAIVARARTLQTTEADCLVSLGRELLDRASRDHIEIESNDPLLGWFGPRTAAQIRRIENAARQVLLSNQTRENPGALTNISAIASTFYVALFSVCREAAGKYQTSNPTWIRRHKDGQRRIGLPSDSISGRFLLVLEDMARALAAGAAQGGPPVSVQIGIADTSKSLPQSEMVDLVLTSPPYCTRIDYTAATRIQLAVLNPILPTRQADLSRQMTGSIRVPGETPDPDPRWGRTCLDFLSRVKSHPSKASSGYYYKTHADYFFKMAASLQNVSNVIKPKGVAVLVVQDSFYKDVHNDLPAILTEMASAVGLTIERRVDFVCSHTIASSHPHAAKYRNGTPATESVLCMRKAA